MSTLEKKKEKKYIRRSGAKIMASLVVLLGSLSYIMILAVINGSLGFISAMGVTVFGAMGVAKALGEQIALSYGWIIGLTVRADPRAVKIYRAIQQSLHCVQIACGVQG